MKAIPDFITEALTALESKYFMVSSLRKATKKKIIKLLLNGIIRNKFSANFITDRLLSAACL